MASEATRAPVGAAPSGASTGLSNGALRVLTALAGLPIVVAAVWFGGWWFGALLALVALVAQRELYAFLRAAGTNPAEGFGLAMGALVGVRALWPHAADAALAVGAVYACTVPFRQTRSNPLLDAAGTALGVLYPTLLLTSLTGLRLRAEFALPGNEPFWLVLLVIGFVFVGDTAAYYVGRAFGRRPLAPRVSPKKTWEGAAGGLAGALAVGAGVKALVLPNVPWALALALALLAAVAGPLGDLAESKLKRAVGAKDSGTLLPGHGGLLDRFDALIVVAPLAYVLLVWALGMG